MIRRRDVVVALVAAGGTLTGVAVVEGGQRLIGSSVYDVLAMPPVPNRVGSTRQVLRGPTATLEQMEVHVTTLNPGDEPHPPHKHPNEEMIIIREGTLETLSAGEWKRVGPGAVIFNASNVPHGLRNVGTVPAVYHVINWKTDKTPAGDTVVLGR